MFEMIGSLVMALVSGAMFLMTVSFGTSPSDRKRP
jgi:hypothetical protein